MQKIICKKPCSIGSGRYAVGDEVPESMIAPGRKAALVSYGLIAVEDVPEAPVSTDTPNAQKEPEQPDTDAAVIPDSSDEKDEKKPGRKAKEQ